MKTIRALRGTTVALLVVAGALPAVQAQGIPSVEACIRYAEADAAYDAAFEAALQQAKAAYAAAYEAAMQPAKAAYDVAHEAAERQALAVYEAAYEAVKHPAQQALETAYFASYDLDGGPRSDVQDVMVKLREHHRQRCRELHGL